ncbi:MAG: endonuclease/exonuclease/phosphatase family protein [Planctomycetaceae bacterium]
MTHNRRVNFDVTNSGTTHDAPNAPAAGKPPRRTRRRVAATLALLIAIPLALFAINGVLLSRGESPYTETISEPPAESLADRDPLTVKVLAFNLAKCFAVREVARFDDVATVGRLIEQIADLIRAEQPDFVFLSEVLTECGPCPIDQVSALARAAGMHVSVFGENFNFGLPLYRVVGGSAILSRWPVEAVANPSLAGRRPFYVAKNNRRVLWSATRIAGQRVLLTSIHNDSFNRDNNARQMQQILEYAGEQPTLMAGDFNALPDWPAIQAVRESGRFCGVFEGPLTFPSDAPSRQLDYIFAPASWELLDHRVIESAVSDHLPVVAQFRIRW